MQIFEKLRDVGSNAKENFCQVNDWLYRGGDPTKSLLPQLREAKIKTVISLRHRASIRKAEQEFVGPLDMELIEVPMTYQSLSEESIDKALDAIVSNKRNIYVHCDHGQDRTGIVIAAFRVVHEGWSWQDARRELIAMGFHQYKWFLMERRLKKYLQHRSLL